MSKKPPSAKQWRQTIYQHHLLWVPTRESWEYLCRKSLTDPHAEIPAGVAGHVLNTEWNDGGHVIAVWINPNPWKQNVATRVGIVAHEAAPRQHRRDREDVGSGAVLGRRCRRCDLGDDAWIGGST